MVIAPKKTRHGSKGAYARVLTMALAGAALAGFTAQTAAAESRSFAFNMFYPATYTQPDNCPEGVNPTSHEIFRNALITTGTPPEKAEHIIEEAVKQNGNAGYKPITERGKIGEKQVNAYTNPLSVPDPGFKTAVGKFALGFNLDGRGADDASAFENPWTHEKGVDNQLFRIYGCLANYQATPPAYPNYPLETWEMVRDTMPAWLITVTADDFSKDGEVTISVDRALNHLLRDAKGHARSLGTFRIDGDPRSHNVFKGKIEKGVITAAAPKLYFLGDQFFFPDFDFTQVKMTMEFEEDGHAHGMVGGYLPWLPIYYQHGQNGLNAETFRGMDMVGLYRALMRVADADPDPATGQNRRMSTAWLMELIPVFTVPADGGPGKVASDTATIQSARAP